MRLEMLAPVPAVTAAQDGRTLSGTALPYGIPGRTSAGTVTVDAGAVVGSGRSAAGQAVP